MGAGSFGRGKLIFQRASKTSSIICDSLRHDDKKYVAFDRKIVRTKLVQQRVPLQGDEAKGFKHGRKGDGSINWQGQPKKKENEEI